MDFTYLYDVCIWNRASLSLEGESRNDGRIGAGAGPSGGGGL